MELSGSGLSISAKPIKPSSTSRRTSYVALNKKPTTNSRKKISSNNQRNNNKDSAKKMYRAKTWSPIVEEFYRFQQCGWKDLREYEAVHGPPDRWDNDKSGPVKCTKVKSNGFFKYWSRERECEDRYLNQVKIFEY